MLSKNVWQSTSEQQHASMTNVTPVSDQHNPLHVIYNGILMNKSGYQEMLGSCELIDLLQYCDLIYNG